LALNSIVDVLSVDDAASWPCSVNMRSVYIAIVVLVNSKSFVYPTHLAPFNYLGELVLAPLINRVMQLLRSDPHTTFGALVRFPANRHIVLKTHCFSHRSDLPTVARRQNISQHERARNRRHINASNLLTRIKLKLLHVCEDLQVKVILWRPLICFLKLNYLVCCALKWHKSGLVSILF
jgi:hypothetical protein